MPEFVLAVAALPTGAHARAALTAWEGADGRRAVATLGPAGRELLATLHAAIEANQAVPSAQLRTTVRAARLLEGVRGPAARDACQEVLEALAQAGVRPLIVGGCALAERLYGGWAERHCGRLELIVSDDEVERAARALGTQALHGRFEAVHPSGFPVDVRTRLFPSMHRNPRPGDIRDHRIDGRVAGVPVVVLDDPAALLHSCAGAGLGPDRDLWWVVDGGLLVLRRPDLDWERFLAIADRSGVALAALPRLRRLAEDAAVPIPVDVLATLKRAARSGAIRRLLAPRRRLRSLMRR